MSYRLSSTTRAQLLEIHATSIESWGDLAAGRYQELLFTVFDELSHNPVPHGHRVILAKPQTLAYHIRHSRSHLPPRERVSAPRHIVVYGVGADGTVDILGLVHDRMRLERFARRLTKDAIF